MNDFRKYITSEMHFGSDHKNYCNTVIRLVESHRLFRTLGPNVSSKMLLWCVIADVMLKNYGMFLEIEIVSQNMSPKIISVYNNGTQIIETYSGDIDLALNKLIDVYKNKIEIFVKTKIIDDAYQNSNKSVDAYQKLIKEIQEIRKYQNDWIRKPEYYDDYFYKLYTKENSKDSYYNTNIDRTF